MSIWDRLRHFSKDEFDNPDRMSADLLGSLDAFRDFIKKPVVINSDYRSDSEGYHGQGLAVDIHVKDMDLIDVMLAAMRFNFTGIGVYDSTIWNSPGLHLDKRPTTMRALWGCKEVNGERLYVALDGNFIRGL